MLTLGSCQFIFFLFTHLFPPPPPPFPHSNLFLSLCLPLPRLFEHSHFSFFIFLSFWSFPIYHILSYFPPPFLSAFSSTLFFSLPLPPPPSPLFLFLHPLHLLGVHTAAGIPPSDGSRSSSTLGYLEPRPSSESLPTNSDVSPRDIHEDLMNKVTGFSTCSEEENETRSEPGGEVSDSLNLSSQSLDRAEARSSNSTPTSPASIFQWYSFQSTPLAFHITYCCHCT